MILALAGLAPEGGEPQLWCMRALTSGLTWRSGWLSQQDHPTFEAFLQPLTQLEWPILAVLSDKHTGLRPAVATVLPESRYQFCQAHYLHNLAEPLAEADAACKVDLRKVVRQQLGDLSRHEPQATPAPIGVLTVTGLLPSPIGPPPAPLAREAQSPPPSASPAAMGPEADEIVTARLRHTRSLLTLKGRPPFRLAGLETSERLDHVARLRLVLVAERSDPRLVQLSQGLQAALSPFAAPYQALQQGMAWLRDIASSLEPAGPQPCTGEQVAKQRRGYRDTLRPQPALAPTLGEFGPHLDTVSRSYWPGLFHCYDVPGLPRTHNESESWFRDTSRYLLRTTGQKGLTKRTLQRQGAWALLPRPPIEAQ